MAITHLYEYQSKQKVQFYDCDPMGVVWHGNYLRFLEVARGEFLDLIDYGYHTIDREGYFFPIVEETMKYMSSLRLGDEFIVKTFLDEYELRLVHRFEIWVGDKIYVKGKTVQVALKQGDTELTFSMPKKFRDNIEKLLAQTAKQE